MAHKEKTVALEERTQSAKGLSKGSIGLLGATVIGIACVAPAYTLTGALGPTAAAVGLQVPAVILVGFIPMLLTAFGYKELNSALPDSGTSFTWGVRAFGPYLGWITGWGCIIAMIVVLSNIAGIAVDFFYLAISQLGFLPDVAESIASLKDNVAVNIITCLIFIALATLVSYRDMQATQRLQYILVGAQLLVFLGFGAVMFYQAYVSGAAFDFSPVKLSWFNPLEIESFGALASGISISLFIFWGWDVTLTINEETKDAEKTPGRAATLTVISVVLVYLFVSVGSMAYAGVGGEGIGLGNPEIQDNVFFALAGPVLGGAAILMSITVLISSAASLQSTFMSPARTMLAMGHYGALHRKFATIHPRHFTPSVATIVAALITAVFYAVMRFISVSVLWDTVATLGLMICFYYGLTAYSCVWYFRKEWFKNAHNFFQRFLFPLLGGVILTVLFFQTLVESMDPSFGSGSQIAGIGLVFWLSLFLIALGIVVMIYQRIVSPAFFQGKTGLFAGIAGDKDEARYKL